MFISELILSIIFGVISLMFTGDDKIWFCVIMGLSFVIVGGLHLYAEDEY